MLIVDFGTYFGNDVAFGDLPKNAAPCSENPGRRSERVRTQKPVNVSWKASGLRLWATFNELWAVLVHFRAKFHELHGLLWGIVACWLG